MDKVRENVMDRLSKINSALIGLILNNESSEKLISLKPTPIEIANISLTQVFGQNIKYNTEKYKELSNKYAEKLSILIADLMDEGKLDLVESLLILNKMLVDSLLATISDENNE